MSRNSKLQTVSDLSVNCHAIDLQQQNTTSNGVTPNVAPQTQQASPGNHDARRSDRDGGEVHNQPSIGGGVAVVSKREQDEGCDQGAGVGSTIPSDTEARLRQAVRILANGAMRAAARQRQTGTAPLLVQAPDDLPPTAAPAGATAAKGDAAHRGKTRRLPHLKTHPQPKVDRMPRQLTPIIAGYQDAGFGLRAT